MKNTELNEVNELFLLKERLDMWRTLSGGLPESVFSFVKSGICSYRDG
jgi:hypothetical protein